MKAVLAGVVALAASAGIALVATASNAGPVCPEPLRGRHFVGPVVVTDCTVDHGPIFIGCDPGPCYTSAPQE